MKHPFILYHTLAQRDQFSNLSKPVIPSAISTPATQEVSDVNLPAE